MWTEPASKDEERVTRDLYRKNGMALRRTTNGWFLAHNRTYDPTPIGPWSWGRVIEFVNEMLDLGYWHR
jgi:hypothetical protein